ncbi:cupredoxin domain-containing protein [Candidatus Kaiserbacteria bacterium]|nr:cupredoxin domain-containing protein [Candidatus Kaiserbacteria bacterium]
MNKSIFVSVAVSGLIVGSAFWLVSLGPKSDNGEVAQTASIIDGTQVVDISAKGGYSPRMVIAKAGIPTILRVSTRGTFDCSASLVIPKLSYQKFLQQSGTEDIVIAPEQARGTLQGLCSMGMYNFQVIFQ